MFDVGDNIILLFIVFVCFFCQRVSTSKFAGIEKHSIKKYFKNENKNTMILIENFLMKVQSLHQS